MCSANRQERFSKREDAESYNAYAESYAKYIEIISEPLAEKICHLAELNPGQRVLDIACGTGVSTRVASELIGAGGTAIGIDYSAGMLREASRFSLSHTNISFMHMDAEDLEFDENEFDRVVSLCAILHFPNVRCALAESFRVLKPGGRAVFSFGAGVPCEPAAVFRHKIKRVLQMLRHRCAFAPSVLLDSANKHISLTRRERDDHEGSVLTTWSKRRPAEYITEKMREVGFLNVKCEWLGYDFEFSNSADYWEAQTAIVTEVRKRLEIVSNDVRDQIKTDFFKRANDILRSNGKLYYPYGAIFIRGEKAR